MPAAEQTTVDALAVDAAGLAHLPDEGALAICGAPVVRMMHPSERLRVCHTCAAVAFRWN